MTRDTVPVIEIEKLHKSYGLRPAVNNLNLHIKAGEIFGFVGPNGAGKTSTIRMLVGLLQPTSGEIRIGGYSVPQAPSEVKRQVGYMPDFFGAYPDLHVWEYLDFFAACYFIPEAQRPTLIDGLLELVDLNHRRQDLVDQLSRGMKQRLSLARALIHDPKVLILDEPASGLDPRARVEIRALLVELSHMGKTIFFSTHILADVAEICTQVGIIEAGNLVALGSLEELQLKIMPRRSVEVTILEQVELALEFLQTTPGIENVTQLSPRSNGARDRFTFEFSGDDQALSAVLSALIQEGVPVLHFSEDQRDLESVFLQATQGLVT